MKTIEQIYKELKPQTNEGVLDIDQIEKDMPKANIQEFVEQHYQEFLSGKFGGSSKPKWGKKGLDTKDQSVRWNIIVDYWKQGICIPIEYVDYVNSDSSMYLFPKNMEDKVFLVDVIWNNAKIKSFDFKTSSKWDAFCEKMMYHKGLQRLYFSVTEPKLPNIDFSKVKAKDISFSREMSHDWRGGVSHPWPEYKKISGWTGNTMKFDYTFGIADADLWRAGKFRVLEFNEDNIQCLDFLLSKNNIKKKRIDYNCMFVYNGSNRSCAGKPYYAWIEKDGNSYKFTLKN